MKKTLFVSLSILVMAACAQTKETTYTQKKIEKSILLAATCRLYYGY